MSSSRVWADGRRGAYKNNEINEVVFIFGGLRANLFLLNMTIFLKR